MMNEEPRLFIHSRPGHRPRKPNPWRLGFLEPAGEREKSHSRGEAGTQDVGGQTFEGLWLIRFHGRVAVDLKAVVAPVRDVLGKLGAEAALGDHHGQDLLAKSGVENVRVESGNELEGVVTLPQAPSASRLCRWGCQLSWSP